MELHAEFAALPAVAADWLIVGIWEDAPLEPAVAALDDRLQQTISHLKESQDFTGELNQLVPILGGSGPATRRLLLVGLGQRSTADVEALTGAAAAAGRSLTSKKVGRIALAVPTPPDSLGWQQVARALGVGLHRASQGPGLRKSKPDRHAPDSLVLVAPPGSPEDMIRQGTRQAQIEGEAVALTRELVNMPPCELYPASFAERAAAVARQGGIECTVHDEQWLAQQGMNALLGVAQGSDRPPRLVLLRYHGGGDRLLGLVGKGVTFDSGGLSLKTTEQMLDMKCDMAGAATVLGAMQAIAHLRLPLNILGVLALVENMPSGRAFKLGDVFRARNGKTIEIHNTDAEGRVILADALSLAVEEKVNHLVDLATLTGSCMIALGTEVAGLMSNNEAWGAAVQAAARHAGEKVWPLPMFPMYGQMIKSKVADIKNTGGTRYGGAITAAKFLEEFVGEVPWAHLDIAGPAWAEQENATRDSGGTGAYVRTLVELASAYPGL